MTESAKPSPRLYRFVEQVLDVRDDASFADGLQAVLRGVVRALNGTHGTIWAPKPPNEVLEGATVASDDFAMVMAATTFPASDIWPYYKGHNPDYFNQYIEGKGSRVAECFRTQRDMYYPTLEGDPRNGKPGCSQATRLEHHGLTATWCIHLPLTTLVRAQTHYVHGGIDRDQLHTQDSSDGIAQNMALVVSVDGQPDDMPKRIEKHIEKQINWLAAQRIEQLIMQELELMGRHLLEVITDIEDSTDHAAVELAILVADALEFDGCSIYQKRPSDRAELAGSYGPSLPAENETAMLVNQIVDDCVIAIREARTAEHPEGSQRNQIKQTLIAPITMPRGNEFDPVGGLCLINKKVELASWSPSWSGREGDLETNSCHEYPINWLDIFRVQRAALRIAPLLKIGYILHHRDMMLKRARHDAKVPSTVICNLASRLQHRDGAWLRQRAEYVDETAQQIFDLADIISLLGDLSRISVDDRAEVQLDDRNLIDLDREVIAPLVSLMNRIAGNYKLVQNDPIKVSSASREERPLPPMHVDARLIRVAVYNLLDNAMKYSFKEGYVWIEYRNRSSADYVEIVFRNSGIPIQDDEIETVFNPYVRGREVARTMASGAGLGLSFTRRLIQLHHGNLILESRDAPIIFSMRLPRVLASVRASKVSAADTL